MHERKTEISPIISSYAKTHIVSTKSLPSTKPFFQRISATYLLAVPEKLDPFQ